MVCVHRLCVHVIGTIIVARSCHVTDQVTSALGFVDAVDRRKARRARTCASHGCRPNETYEVRLVVVGEQYVNNVDHVERHEQQGERQRRGGQGVDCRGRLGGTGVVDEGVYGALTTSLSDINV